MEVDFATLADGVAQRPDGKVDIFGAGIDNINALQVPAQHPSITLVMRFLVTRHEAENPHQLQVILMGADGNELARSTGEVVIPAEQAENLPAGRSLGVNLVLQFAGLVFPTFGAYQFSILWDGNEARPAIPLVVSEVQPPAGV
jgi:hypothetical protein